MIYHFDLKNKTKQKQDNILYLWAEVGWISCIIILYEVWSVLNMTLNPANGMKNIMSYTLYTLMMCGNNIY